MTAPFSLIYVPNKLIVRDDAVATARNISAHETMFRLSIANELFGTVMFIFVALALYRLFVAVDKTHAALLALLALLSVPIAFVGTACELAALRFLDTPDLAMLLLRIDSSAIVVSEIFWGLWLVPLGILVMRSGFLPRVLGVLLLVNAGAYVIQSLTQIVLPEYSGIVGGWMRIPETGELWMILALLFWPIRSTSAALVSPQGALA